DARRVLWRSEVRRQPRWCRFSIGGLALQRHRGARASSMTRELFDVVVIGSGAGGAPLAAALAEGGARVLVLEKGPRHRLQDFTHDEIAMCRRDFFVPFVDDDPHTLRRNDTEVAERTREGWISQCVGGGTVHMSGFAYRLQASDFQLASRTGG